MSCVFFYDNFVVTVQKYCAIKETLLFTPQPGPADGFLVALNSNKETIAECRLRNKMLIFTVHSL